jgi:predicted nucleic acid-binding protein
VAQDSSTIDTSVLVSLQCVGLLGALAVLFRQILVPRTVRREVGEGRSRNELVARALAEYAIFLPCDDCSLPNVRLLLDTRAAQEEGRDEGEAEAVVQAAERNCMVLVDDKLGRIWARGHALDYHGTLWVLWELRRKETIRELRPFFEALIRGRRRQPREEMNTILAKFGEEEISVEEYRILEQA